MHGRDRIYIVAVDYLDDGGLSLLIIRSESKRERIANDDADESEIANTTFLLFDAIVSPRICLEGETDVKIDLTPIKSEKLVSDTAEGVSELLASVLRKHPVALGDSLDADKFVQIILPGWMECILANDLAIDLEMQVQMSPKHQG